MEHVIINQASAEMVAERLLDIGAIKLNPQNPFTWSSGWKSPIYCDNRLSLSYPVIRKLIKESLSKAIRDNFKDAEYIGGVATAGIPQGALVADALELPFIYVRPKPKDHGMGNLIEGRIEKGKKVVLVEDLISTGGSSLRAAAALKDAGLKVVGMVAIFTYGFEVAEKSFQEAGIPLVCLTDFNQLITVAAKNQQLDEDALVHVKSWRLDPSNWMP